MRFPGIPYRLQFYPILLNVAPDGFTEVIYELKPSPHGLKVYPLPHTQNNCLKLIQSFIYFQKNNHEKEFPLTVIIHCDDNRFL